MREFLKCDKHKGKAVKNKKKEASHVLNFREIREGFRNGSTELIVVEVPETRS